VHGRTRCPGRRKAPAGIFCALVFAVTAAAGPAGAEETDVGVNARGGIYQDDDATQVISAVVAVEAAALGWAKIRAHGLVDIVSTASVDVISAATDRWEETRYEFGAAPSYDDGTRTVSLAYRYSTENDWDSHTFGLGGSHDFFSHNLKLSMGLTYGYNAVGRADDETFSEKLEIYGVSVGAVMVASRNDIFSFTYAPSYFKGYQASPYRFAYYNDPGSTTPLGTPEVVPDLRMRHALVVEYNRHLFMDSALRSNARAYLDNWGIYSGTVGTEYVHGIGGFEPSVFVRGYLQTGATFYEDGYTTRKRYMTADREHSPFWDLFAGIRLAYRVEHLGVFDELRAEAKGAAFLFVFQDYDRLPERRGFTAEIGLGGTL